MNTLYHRGLTNVGQRKSIPPCPIDRFQIWAFFRGHCGYFYKS